MPQARSLAMQRAMPPAMTMTIASQPRPLVISGAKREAEATVLAAVLAVLAIAALAVVQVLGRRPAS